MKVVTISKNLFNPISLPGMGRSMEVNDLSATDIMEIRTAFSKGELYVDFFKDPGTKLKVIQLWANPHAPQVTLFV